MTFEKPKLSRCPVLERISYLSAESFGARHGDGVAILRLRGCNGHSRAVSRKANETLRTTGNSLYPDQDRRRENPSNFGSSDPQNTVTTLADSLSHSVHSPHFNTTMYISPIMLPTKNGSMIHGIIATHLPFISLLESNGTRANH